MVMQTNRTLLTVAFGYGLYLLWSLVGSSGTLFSAINAPAIEALAIRNPFEHAIWIAALVLSAILVFKLPSDQFKRVLTIVAGCAVGIGTLGAYICAWVSPDYLDVIQALTLVSSVFIALWGERICEFDERETVVCVAVSGIFSFALVLICSLMEPHVQAAVHVLAGAGSAAVLVYVLNSSVKTAESNHREITQPAFKQALTSIPVAPFVALGLFATVVVLLQSYSERKASVPDELLWIIAGLAVYTVILLVVLLFKKQIRASSFSRPILPLLILTAFMVFATDFGQQSLEVFAVGCSWVYYRFFTWIIWRAGTVRQDAVPFFTIAMGQIILAVGASVGSVLYVFLQSVHAPLFAAMAVICVISVLVATYGLDTNHVAQMADSKPLFDPQDLALCERCVDSATSLYGLSDRERTVARLLIRGFDNQEIQDELVIATTTLRTHLRNLYRKTDTHSREELVVLLRSLI